MIKRKLLVFISVIVFLGALVPLVMGSSILTYPLIEQPYFPFGNFLTAIGYVALPCIFYYGISGFNEPNTKRERFFSNLFKVLIVIAALWIPVSYLLSGNLSNSFGNSSSYRGSQAAGEVFWIFSYTLAALPIVIWLIYLLLKLFPRKGKFPFQ